jgi:hypothetical protein
MIERGWWWLCVIGDLIKLEGGMGLGLCGNDGMVSMAFCVLIFTWADAYIHKLMVL